nr:carbamoyltransferase C-terminal domain-containing protein [Paenibacillus xylanexedens]
MYVLGISGALGHDAAACLMKNGQLLAMVEEERLSRKTHSIGHPFPELAIEYCLNQEGITLDDIDYIALSWDHTLIPPEKNPLRPEYYEDPSILFSRERFRYTKFPKVEVVDHHLAHAASAFYCSPFEEASVLVVDGAGEHRSTSLYWGKDRELIKVEDVHHNESLGDFYASVTLALGFDWTDAGKTMGLASYGSPEYEIPLISLDDIKGYKINIDHDVDMMYVMGIWLKKFMGLGIKRNQKNRNYNPFTYKYSDELEFGKDYKNLAASAQKALEECYLNLVKVLVERTGSRNLCLAGGVALNCVANGKVERSGIVDSMFIQPAAYDAGAALGAAAEVSTRLGFNVEKMQHAYAGPSYSNEQIIQTLKHLGIPYHVSEDASVEAAGYLADGLTVGWFQGRAEFGPRALGNRSILANPSVEGIADKVNKEIKFREGFRPFGPSVLEEFAPDWFEEIEKSPYMLKSYQVRDDKAGQIKGVVHVDGSSRPQTVSLEANEPYYRLIDAFRKKTGIPMVLNTSFNLRGEPMVCSPYDAIRTYFSSGLDVLVLNDIFVKKG